ncbi:MAG TPA: lytic transglycosylase domain-containing protein [Terriglobales bacterium]|nr:lytic transglycosylase domain-containing protein [Terriglobales bacterium]
MQTKAKIGLILLLSLATGVASASDVAILRNGFTIRHERRISFGSNTRLYMSADQTSFVDIPTAEIDRIEPDLTPPPEAPPDPAPVMAAAPAPASASPGPAAVPAALATTPGPSAALQPRLNIPDAVSQASERYRLDPDLLNSVIRAESGFNPHAVSRKGAQGLMQLMPETASKLGVPNAFDPGANVDGGTRYLRELLERYNFDLVKALAAYNAGPKRVEQYGGVPPYYETRAYVASIVRDFNRKKLAQQKAAKANLTAPAKVATSKRPASRSAATSKRPAPPTGN